MDAAQGIIIEITFAQVFAVFEVCIFLWTQGSLFAIPDLKCHALTYSIIHDSTIYWACIMSQAQF